MEPETNYWLLTLAISSAVQCMESYQSLDALMYVLVLYADTLYRPVINYPKSSVTQLWEKFKHWITYQADIYLETEQHSQW